ncbi:MAG: hypothetical protein HYY17_09215 [Planctomycetes bacterium]|nr:hypothetical protein [Planctomycetota bacterium]
MSHFISQMWKLAQIVCVAIVVLVGLLAIWLAWTGSISRERLRGAYGALQGRRSEPPGAVRPAEEEEWRRIEETRSRMDTTHLKREVEWHKLHDMTEVELARLESERKKIEEARAEMEKEKAALKKERLDLDARKTSQAQEANLPIYEEMKGQDLAALMTGWDDKEIVQTLRLLSPEKAAQVLRSMSDAASPYRQRPPTPPAGFKTRYELIADAMRQ